MRGVAHVVVGTDGAEESDAGLVWALWFADHAGLPLEVVHAHQQPFVLTYPLAPGAFQVSGEDDAAATERAHRALHRACRRVGVHGVEASARAVQGSSGPVLLDAARHASLVVVTRRERSELTRVLLGSTVSALLHHSPAPVAVVPEARTAPAAPARVVVGVDRSEHSDAAVAWAADLADQVGAVLEPVHVRPAFAGPLDPIVDEQAHDRAQVEALHAAVRRLAPRLRAEVAPRVLVGRPGNRLVEACGPADVLVVGARRPGGPARWLLGGTSSWVATHAPCTVVVAR